MESPPGADHDDSASAAVCCMCGDRGLPGELFQCSLCRLRLQHRYMISGINFATLLIVLTVIFIDIAIHTIMFRYCSELYPREAAYRSCNWCLRDLGGAGGSNNPPVHKTPKNPRDVSGGCSRSAFSVEGNPIKKKGAGRVTTVAAAKGVQQANNVRKPRFSRVKVRRYKLLAEVIC
jgi:hypothetical protein